MKTDKGNPKQPQIYNLYGVIAIRYSGKTEPEIILFLIWWDSYYFISYFVTSQAMNLTLLSKVLLFCLL